MGNPFSKDGAITKITEAIPGGGWITAPIHAAAGNPIHAAQAAIAGFDTVASTVALGPVGAIVANAGNAGLSSIFDELGLNDDKKEVCVQAARIGDQNEAGGQQNKATDNYNRAAEVLLQAGTEKISENCRQLSAESGGRRCLKSSIHGTFLRAYDSDWRVDMACGPAKAWEHWYVEDWKGKVVFKAIHSPGRFLRAHSDGLSWTWWIGNRLGRLGSRSRTTMGRGRFSVFTVDG